jgi:hypothetical protein
MKASSLGSNSFDSSSSNSNAGQSSSPVQFDFMGGGGGGSNMNFYSFSPPSLHFANNGSRFLTTTTASALFNSSMDGTERLLAILDAALEIADAPMDDEDVSAEEDPKQNGRPGTTKRNIDQKEEDQPRQ